LTTAVLLLEQVQDAMWNGEQATAHDKIFVVSQPYWLAAEDVTALNGIDGAPSIMSLRKME